MSRKKEPKDPIVVKELPYSDLDLIQDRISEFIDQGDSFCDPDTISISIYDNGDIELSGTFSMDHSENIII